MGYLGLYSLWIAGIHKTGFWSAAAALFWALSGWRMLYMIGKTQRLLTYKSDL